MERDSLIIRVLGWVRANWAACLLISISAHLPFIVFGLGRYLSRPDGRTRSWFDAYEMPLAAIALLCCVAVPVVVRGPLWRRFVFFMAALGIFAGAILVAAFLSMAAFGIPMD